MEVVIIMAILGAIVFFFKRTFSGFVYAVGMVDIFLRIVAFLKGKILGGSALTFVNRWFPSSIYGLIESYTNGVLETILIWIYVIIMIIFEAYIIKGFIKKI